MEQITKGHVGWKMLVDEGRASSKWNAKKGGGEEEVVHGVQVDVRAGW